MQSSEKETPESNLLVWKEPLAFWAAMIGIGFLLIVLFYSGLAWMVHLWTSAEEYGYGFLIPVIALFLIWQRKDSLERISFPGSWAGTLIVLLAIGLLFLGDLSTLYIVIQYAFLVALLGCLVAFTGWRGFRHIAMPFILLIFMIPLPNFLYQGLSSQLQLISSALGVSVIRLFNIPVLLEGNVIDLGTFKLQVVEACSGLRYLFPLMTLGFIAAYLFKGAFWKRAVIFLSSIPITVLMNSFRIGAIGIMVEYWGDSMAKGFLHYFEGWAVFMACIGLLVIEMWILARVGDTQRPLRDVFGLDFPTPTPTNAMVQYRPLPKPFLVTAVLLAVVTILSFTLPKRIEILPQRKDFSEFPMTIGEWHGQRGHLEQFYINVLKFDDYIIADYTNRRHDVVNFYIAYYASQRAGDSAHSPRTCIPGGGWEIAGLSQRRITGVAINGQALSVNRVVIQMGTDKQLVYYWFQEQGRIVTNEYLVKWYLFWDALTRNRTDGALVRLVTYVRPGEDLAKADRRLVAFTKAVAPQLSVYIPQ